MPVATEKGSIQCDIETMWEFIKDMENWATCMPGYVSFQQVSEAVSIWALKGDLGIFKRTVDFTVTVTEKKRPEWIAFTLEAKSEGIKGEGSYKAVATGVNATDVEFNLEMTGTGFTAKVINVVLAKTLPRDCEQLKENLKKVIETKDQSVDVR